MITKQFSKVMISVLAIICIFAEANAAKSARKSFFLKDEYGDVVVYLCRNGKAILYVDPNKCAENMAKGRACTEGAPYVSDFFEFNKGRQSTVFEGGQPWYQIDDSKESTRLSGGRLDGAVELTWTALDENTQIETDSYCNQ